jgi:hypothetical protein
MVLKRRIVGVLLALALVAAQPGTVVLAQEAPFCAPGTSPSFNGGFAALKAGLGDTMGEPVECEHPEPKSGDTHQTTTTGLAFWRKSTNTPTFTDGYRKWALTSQGLVAWVGSANDPPRNARNVGAGSGDTQAAPGRGVGGGRTPDAVDAPIGAGRPVSPDNFVYKTLDQEPPSEGWPCQSRNPSCGREEWWAQWDEVQDDSPIQFRFIGPGLVTEGRFAEAISVLWIWPEGREMLQTAANHGVAIYSSPEIARRAFAAYRPMNRTLLINPNFTEVSTWLLADVLAHELRHAADHATNTRMGNGYEPCVAREQSAFQTEARFVRWLADRQGGLPSADQVQKSLSRADQALFSDVFNTLTAQNLDAQVEESYRPICSQGR